MWQEQPASQRAPRTQTALLQPHRMFDIEVRQHDASHRQLHCRQPEVMLAPAKQFADSDPPLAQFRYHSFHELFFVVSSGRDHVSGKDGGQRDEGGYEGQAGGVAASLVAKEGCASDELDIRQLQNGLIEQNAYLGEDARLKELGLGR